MNGTSTTFFLSFSLFFCPSLPVPSPALEECLFLSFTLSSPLLSPGHNTPHGTKHKLFQLSQKESEEGNSPSGFGGWQKESEEGSSPSGFGGWQDVTASRRTIDRKGSSGSSEIPSLPTYMVQTKVVLGVQPQMFLKKELLLRFSIQ